ncbi:GUN4 domain protein [Gloeothece citriformis PCC 7424]|uniref:GUN4 domain protein n=2 Tax=Gloeothece TaxID=28070 RepID=B7K9U3_GLOC7|nr:GUN4 domain protein [Gloeothece citriformis PCC 7424]
MNLNSNEVKLISTKGINYTTLNQLLAQGQWQAADVETSKLMLQIMGKQSWHDVYPADIDHFPYGDLMTIDHLWVKYSGGKFGFSVQKEIWLRVGGFLYADYQTEQQFATQVGWKTKKDWLEYQELTFSLNAPQGHLPLGCDNLRQVWCWALLNRLFSRIVYYQLYDPQNN